MEKGWQHHFAPFTLTHLFVVVAFGIFISFIICLRRCDEVADNQPRRKFLDLTIGWMALAAACFVQIATLIPSRFDYQTSLPLHICDLGMFMVPGALLLRWRSLRAMAYFWGLGLSSLSFIYPDLHFGPADIQFWVFWAGHAAIIGPALYDVTARGFRPHWGDWLFAVKFSIVYVGLLLPIDANFHLNYGYIGKTQGPGSPIDHLGPWPWRVPLMFVLAMTIQFLMLLPWMLGRKNFTQGLPPEINPKAGENKEAGKAGGRESKETPAHVQ
jgi:hypothetical integral membrane protein (TIGR02206 family)